MKRQHISKDERAHAKQLLLEGVKGIAKFLIPASMLHRESAGFSYCNCIKSCCCVAQLIRPLCPGVSLQNKRISPRAGSNGIDDDQSDLP